MGTRRVNIRLPNELIKKADLVAKVAHKNRTEVIKEALQEYIEGIENEAQFKEAVTELYLEDQIEFDTLKTVLGRQDAEAIRTSKTVLEQGDELADELADL
ncbi:ribbon-helix-helix domain-containing protein [Natronosalvus rutilus]|uniref:Ribbon-helix-helix domain-containing protein n=1 Tax=Natronosalvus rutilus TaxID=2953753 RepID=A0A9E7NAU5_9EURY|nr:ribbon-helix-helix domain-containing protein [Natronosalvus rutilus]UTF54887.1 ribbon-helix-helix domain-containing protein [Natronosalvus rutilus]